MKLYLAAPYSKNAEMREAKTLLEATGHVITSTWHDTGAPDCDGSFTAMRHHAYLDLDDLLKAEGLVSFTEPRNASKWSGGGRHVELGFALATRMRVYIVGPIENIYCAMHEVKHARDLAQLIELLLDEENRKVWRELTTPRTC